MTYTLHPKAEAELEAAFDFYAEEGGRGIANAFLQEIDRVAQLLLANPGFGTPGRGGLRSYPARRFPYSLFYRATATGIHILAVAHQHRRPGYWRKRS